MTRFLALVALATSLAVETAPAPARRLPRAVLEDKIRGGWAGQMIGVSLRRADRVPVERQDHRRQIAVAPDRSRTRSTRTISTSR